MTNPLELGPWVIVDLLICKRGEQYVNVEDATDAEFDAWVQSNAVSVKDNGIPGWLFDDRCRLINHVLTHHGCLRFADGSTLPAEETEVNNSAKPKTTIRPEEANNSVKPETIRPEHENNAVEPKSETPAEEGAKETNA